MNKDNLRVLLKGFLFPDDGVFFSEYDIKKETNLYELFDLWNQVPPGLEPLFKVRVSEVLSTISDMKRLDDLLWTLPGEFTPLVESRMLEVLKDVSPDNIPDWFTEMLEDTDDIPMFEAFKEKAIELFNALSRATP